MIHRVSSLVLLFALALPAGLAAQSTDRNAQEPPSKGDEAEAQIFLGAFKAILDYGHTELSDSALWERAIDGLVSELNDPYATVFTPEEYGDFQESTTGDYAGIGVQITQLNDAITITAVFRATPAQDAGLQVGDRILGVDGHSTDEWTTATASDSIRGEPGTEVELLIGREGFEETVPYTITRNNVHISAVALGFLPDSVGYVHLDRVARGSAEEMDSALTTLETSRGIILDLRRNPGGYLDESLAIADLFLDRGVTLASTRGRAPGRSGELEEQFRARVAARVPSKPIVVLVDEYTASAAEIISGALQDHDRALVLGERTFGKGVVQSLIPIPGDRQLRLTTGAWYTPLGRSLHRPRDSEGRPLAENPDTFPTVLSDGGRDLVSGGGIFPDLGVADDTLRAAERKLLTVAGRQGAPLAVRLAELGFQEAQRYRDGEGPFDITDDAFDDFLERLGEVGIPEDLLEDPQARSYLLLRARIQMADRLNDVGKATEFRLERDPVLTEAYRLIRAASSQSDLFALADRTRTERSADASQDGGPDAGSSGGS